MTKSNYEDYFTEQDIKIHPGLPSYIEWDTIRERLWEEYDIFIFWMRWQSCIEQWAYAVDVRNYFRQRNNNNLDWLPHGY